MEKNSLIPVLRVSALILIILLAISCGKKQGGSDASNNLQSESAEYSDAVNGSDADSLKPQYYEGGASSSARSATADSTILKGFKYSWTDSKEIPPIIIIVDDFGYADKDLLQGYADLPREVAFAVLPDLPATKKAAQIAQRTGHDVLIHAPMEAKQSKLKPGERYIKTGHDAGTIASLIDAFHEQMPNAIALNNHMGSTATSDKTVMKAVLEHLARRGLFFVDSVTSGETVGYNMANTLGQRAVRRNLFLDVPDNSDATLAAKISDLGRYKGRVEPVVVITHCHNQAKLDALNKFIAQIKAMGLRLTSLSAYYGGGVTLN